MRKHLTILTTLTLMTALSSCGGAGSGVTTPPGNGGGGTGGGGTGGGGGSTIPTSLQGQWDYGYVSPIEYYDPSSGEYAEQSGTSEILKLKSNGEYERVGILVVTTNSCTSKLLLNQKGTVKLGQKTLTLMPKESYSKGYICNPSKTYESRELKNSEFTWRLDDSGGETVLVLGDPKGEASDSRYNRPRGTDGQTPPTDQPQARGLRGTISAPDGHSLYNTTVIACPVDAGCAQGNGSTYTTIVAQGSEAAYQLKGLDAKAYAVLAWQDTNGSGNVDAGDWVDEASAANAENVRATPPAQDVNLTLTELQ